MPPRRGIPARPLAGSALTAALAAAWLATGCTRNVEPIEIAAGCPGSPVRGPDQWAGEPADRLIDDFEGADNELTKVAGRTGSWVLGTDKTPSGVAVGETSSLCAARGAKAGHFAGEGFTDWGANWTAVFLDIGSSANATALPYDGRAYSGVSFWAAAGSTAVEPLQVPVGLTTMDVAWNGGICTDRCQDFYRTVVPLTRAWQRLTFKFSDLAQAGWGSPQVAMRIDQLVGLILWPQEGPDGGIGVNQPFDIWIDDIRFEP